LGKSSEQLDPGQLLLLFDSRSQSWRSALGTGEGGETPFRRRAGEQGDRVRCRHAAEGRRSLAGMSAPKALRY
jgi:hypothetical protein